MTTRQLISDDGTIRRYKVLDDNNKQIGIDEEPSAGTPFANQGVLITKVISALDQLEQADNNWSSLTPAQKDAAQRLAVRVSAKLTRLYLNRLDNT